MHVPSFIYDITWHVVPCSFIVEILWALAFDNNFKKDIVIRILPNLNVVPAEDVAPAGGVDWWVLCH